MKVITDWANGKISKNPIGDYTLGHIIQNKMAHGLSVDGIKCILHWFYPHHIFVSSPLGSQWKKIKNIYCDHAKF
jgi:hypothetical protein